MNPVVKWVLLVSLAVVAVLWYVMLTGNDASSEHVTLEELQRLEDLKNNASPTSFDSLSAKPSPGAGEPSSAPAVNAKTEPPTDANTIHSLWNAEWELLLLGTQQMHELRRSGQRRDLEKCVDLMNEALPRARALSRQLDALPAKFLELKAAAGHMEMCVTCNTASADFNCNEAGKLLTRFKKEFE